MVLQGLRVPIATVLVYAVALTAAPPASAQYFGRNKVQHKQFEFEVITTEHFQVHFYPEERAAAEETARMAERWYTRLSAILKHDLSGLQPLILYASSPDFRQTNVVSGIGEGTGGVTEGLRRRIVMPVFGTLEETDHVLGHELVHAFQYDIARESREDGDTRSGLEVLPLWFVEGMAEYLSIGHVDPHTAMWIRDAARDKEKLPSIDQLDNPEHFPYRWGQAFWAYVAGRWGDNIVRRMLDEAIRVGGASPAIERVLGVKDEELSAQWHEAISAQYAQTLQAGTRASKTGRALGARREAGTSGDRALAQSRRPPRRLSLRARHALDRHVSRRGGNGTHRQTTDQHRDRSAFQQHPVPGVGRRVAPQ